MYNYLINFRPVLLGAPLQLGAISARLVRLWVNPALINKKAQLTQGLGATAVRVRRPLWQKSKLSRKPHPRTKHHVDWQTGCEVMAIFCTSKITVSRHLRFDRSVNSAIRSADPENHRAKHGVDRMYRLRDIRL